MGGTITSQIEITTAQHRATKQGQWVQENGHL